MVSPGGLLDICPGLAAYQCDRERYLIESVVRLAGAVQAGPALSRAESGLSTLPSLRCTTPCVWAGAQPRLWTCRRPQRRGPFPLDPSGSGEHFCGCPFGPPRIASSAFPASAASLETVVVGSPCRTASRIMVAAAFHQPLILARRSRRTVLLTAVGARTRDAAFIGEIPRKTSQIARGQQPPGRTAATCRNLTARQFHFPTGASVTCSPRLGLSTIGEVAMSKQYK